MNFSWFYAKTVTFAKKHQRNLSQFITRIGQIAVAIGIIVSLVTIGVGIGAKKAIKQKLADFNGHITLKSFDSNNSYNSVGFAQNEIKSQKILATHNVASIQYYAIKSGIIRTKTDFEGVVYKGLSANYDKKRFQEFIIEGKAPEVNNDSLSFEVAMSKKTAQALHLKVNDSFLIYFLDENNQKPIYRRFTISGLYQTDISDIDQTFLVGDIKQLQRINNWNVTTIGGAEIFLNDIEKLEDTFPLIEDEISLKLNAEKATTTYANITDWIQLFDNNIYVVLSIMMMVVALNMIMIFLILIIENTQSIGLLKVLGSSNFSIIKIYILRAVFVMFPGLLLGNIIAILFLALQKIYKIIPLNPENYFISSVPVYFDIPLIVAVNLGTIIISVIVMLLPSYIIAKISPVKAIKYE